MSVYVNESPSQLILHSPLAIYTFPSKGYYAANSELAPYMTLGQLTERNNSYPAANPGVAQADRIGLFSEEDVQIETGAAVNVTDRAARLLGAVTANAGTNLNTSALATQATLALVLAKIITAPATAANQTSVITALTGAQPNVVGLDAVGQDAAATTAYTTPNRICKNLLVSCEDFGAVVSVIGAADTQQVFVNANYQELLTGLAIPAATLIFAKNLVTGSNFTNLRLVAW